MTIETLVQNFLATFETDPAVAEKEITAGLLSLAEGDEDVYLSLRNQAGRMVAAALEAQLRAEVAEANLTHEEVVEALEEAAEAVLEDMADATTGE